MSLHLNLYHEVNKAKALKRRDPLKLTMYALSAVVAGFAGYYALQALKLHSLNSELATVKAEFDKLDPAAKAAKAREDELSAQLKSGNLLVKKVENRFYWAPLLEQIMQVVPREVQVTRLVGDLAGEGARRCTLSIDGLSAGQDARNVAETLRTAIAEKISPNHKNVTSKFRMLEDGTEMAMLDGKQVPTATFAINVEFTSGDEPAPEPTRRKR
jgi:Tfp pilus assembly protein PilN